MDIHFRQTTHAHVTTIKCLLWLYPYAYTLPPSGDGRNESKQFQKCGNLIRNLEENSSRKCGNLKWQFSQVNNHSCTTWYYTTTPIMFVTEKKHSESEMLEVAEPPESTIGEDSQTGM